MIRPNNFSGILCGLAVSALILPLASFAQVETLTVSAQTIPNNPATTQPKKVVARIWHPVGVRVTRLSCTIRCSNWRCVIAAQRNAPF